MLLVTRLICGLGFFLVTAAAQAQALPATASHHTYQGRVVDTARRPLVGASVWAKGTPVAATTNTEGVFLLSLPNGTYTLLVNYPGYLGPETQITPTDSLLTIVVRSTQPRATQRR